MISVLYNAVSSVISFIKVMWNDDVWNVVYGGMIFSGALANVKRTEMGLYKVVVFVFNGFNVS